MLIQVIGGPTVLATHFTFPDGQRHITLEQEIKYSDVVITTKITCADDLFDLLLIKDILDNGKNNVGLRIEYLMGGRMDRRIDSRQPFTLKVVCDIIRAAKFTYILVLDPHSEATLSRLVATSYFPRKEFHNVLKKYKPRNTIIIIPDKGAKYRVNTLLQGTDFIDIVQCYKDRDEQTGKLSGFRIEVPNRINGKICLIVDDICDGGGTFIGLAEQLRNAGAIRVDLFVTHGIFSKGFINLWKNGIDSIYATDSYRENGLIGENE